MGHDSLTLVRTPPASHISTCASSNASLRFPANSREGSFNASHSAFGSPTEQTVKGHPHPTLPAASVLQLAVRSIIQHVELRENLHRKNTLPLLLCESNWASPTPVSSHSLSRQRYSLERCEQSSTYCYPSPTCGAGVPKVCTPPRGWIPSNSTLFGTATDSAALGGRGRSTTRTSGSS